MIYKYKYCIPNTDWTAPDVYEDCETDKHFIYKNVYDTVFPIIKVEKLYRNGFPWLTTVAQISIKHKNTHKIR